MLFTRSCLFAFQSILLIIATGVPAAGPGAQSTGGDFVIVREVIASGDEPTAGDYRAVVTIGQALTGLQSGGNFTLHGGFHVAAEAVELPDRLFNDRFENP